MRHTIIAIADADALLQGRMTDGEEDVVKLEGNGMQREASYCILPGMTWRRRTLTSQVVGVRGRSVYTHCRNAEAAARMLSCGSSVYICLTSKRRADAWCRELVQSGV